VKKYLLGIVIALCPIATSYAQTTGTVKVNPDTYIRAETDRTFHNISQQAGGVNRWFYIRKPTPLNQQTVVRMNLDTLYSASIVDTSKGATVTIPPLPAGRFMSVLLVDNDHYAPAVYYAPGTYNLPRDTKYLAVIVRTQVFNSKDNADIALANKLQDAVVIKANSADPLPPMQWETSSLKALTEEYEKDSAQYESWTLPVLVVIAVPFAALGAVGGLRIAGLAPAQHAASASCASAHACLPAATPVRQPPGPRQAPQPPQQPSSPLAAASHPLLARLEAHGNTGQRAAGAHGGHKGINRAIRLRPDFRRCGLDMGPAVRHIIELVGPDGPHGPGKPA
jgi:hypothetical protein